MDDEVGTAREAAKNAYMYSKYAFSQSTTTKNRADAACMPTTAREASEKQ
jgi:hypothetical protein